MHCLCMGKILFALMVAALALLLCGCAAQQNAAPPNPGPQMNATAQNRTVAQPPAAPKTYNVEIRNFKFNPLEITINRGDTVRWTNFDPVPHAIVSDSGNEITSGTLENGGTYAHTFNANGTFDYHCSMHAAMRAAVIVQ